MQNTESGDQIIVSTDGTAGPYIVVDVSRLAEVQQLLNDNGIQHFVDPNAVENYNQPVMGVINLFNESDVEQTQQLLDSVE